MSMKIKNISGEGVEMKNGSVFLKAAAGETVEADAKQVYLGLQSGRFAIVDESEAPEDQPAEAPEDKPAKRR